MQDLIGKTIKKRYRVEKLLGRGGMAEVYKVYDQKRASELAIKVLRNDLAHDKIFLRRFEREAHTLAKLQHRNIVRFYGLEKDGMDVFMVMDYIEGESLRDEIFRADKPFSPSHIMEIIQPVCAALHYAHEMGIAHCDIKPANILISKHGEVFVSDFGIARMVDSATSTMVGIGSPAYMAPELILGKDPSPQSDIYSLGIVLYEILTYGERPFTGERAEVTGTTAEKVRWEQVKLDPIPPSRFNKNISSQMETVVLRCLVKNPSKRFASIAHFMDSLKLEEIKTINNPNGRMKKVHVSGMNEYSSLNKTSININWIHILATISIVLGIFTIIRFLSINNNDNENLKEIQKDELNNSESPNISGTNSSINNLSKRCKVAFVSDEGGDWEIYTMNADGSDLTQLTSNSTDDRMPTWSPDGKHIYFSSTRNGTAELFEMDSDGSNQTQLTSSNNDWNDWAPSISPDGQFIVFHSSMDGDDEIYITPITINYYNQITSNDYVDWDPVWSPDGTKIAFVSYFDGNREIHVMNADGTNQNQLTFGSKYAEYPTWSPDGKSIAFAADRGGGYQIYSIDSSGDNLSQLTTNSAAYAPNWLSDGEHITFISIENGDWDIFIMNKDGSNQKQLTFGNSNERAPSWSPECK